MMKTLLTFATAMLCLWFPSHGQTLAQWSLTSSATPNSTATDITASDFARGPGLSAITFGSSGATTNAWAATDQPGSVDYVEVCLEASAANDLNVDSLFFTETRSADGIRYFELRYSTDGFQTETLLLRDTVPDDTAVRNRALSKIGLNACDAQQLCFRWYGFGTEAYDGTWSLSDIRVAGTAPLACTPPANQVLNVAVNNITTNSAGISWGFGSDVLVIAREASQPEVLPCSGTNVTALPTFGNGTDIGQGNYVVYAGTGNSFTLSGLVAGQTYELTIFSYDPNNSCYRTSDALQESFTTLCGTPDAPSSLEAVPGDELVYLNWETPNCSDEVLVLGSESPISVTLTSADGSAYMPDSAYTAGTATQDLPAGVFPLYQGTDTRATITQLQNGTNYYFRIYSRFAGSWAEGPQVSIAPKVPCSENGDFLFLSELHYQNEGVDVDEGVEITGEAGLDLSNYQVIIYKGNDFEAIVDLQDTIPNQVDNAGAVWIPLPGLFEAGSIGLYNKVTDRVVEIFAYRINSTTLEGGPADGMSPPSIPISAQEDNNTPSNFSIQRGGTGSCPSPTSPWDGPMLSSPGIINASQGAPLPISLTDLQAKRQGKNVSIEWQTETELNNDYMVVEHSTDGRTFEEIGQVQGAGTTQQPQLYKLMHYEPATGLNYYRLRQVDFDGQFAYYGPVSVRMNGPEAALTLYPTVATDRITLDFQDPKRQAGEFLLFNSLGQLQRRIQHDGGSLRQSVDVSTLSAGQYLIVWQSERAPQVAQPFFKP
jgi:hypothetical protein